MENASPPTWLSFYKIVAMLLKIASPGLDEDCLGFKDQLEEDYSLTSAESTNPWTPDGLHLFRSSSISSLLPSLLCTSQSHDSAVKYPP